MAIEYGKVDWVACLQAIYPGVTFTGTNGNGNQAEYDDETVWHYTDPRPKPTWAQIVDKWVSFSGAGSGVQYDPHPPGARMFHSKAEDFGGWLYVDPVNGRLLDKETYAMLYKVMGDTYNAQYPGITGTQFGLPKGLAGRVPVFTGASYPYGSMGGEAAHAITTAEMPAHTHGLNANIMVAATSLALTGSVALLGQLYAKIASAATSSAGSGTAMSLMQPYVSLGNLYIYRGKLKYEDMVYYS